MSELPSRQPDILSESSDALFVHEIESENILHSGREWYQPTGAGRKIEINPGFSDILTSEKSDIKSGYLPEPQNNKFYLQ